MSLRPLARGSALGLGTLLVEKISALVLVVALARTLAAEAYGLYAFVVAYLTIFQVLANFGLETTLLRRLSQDPERRAFWLSNALGIRLLLTAVSGAGAVLITPIAAPDEAGLALPVGVGAFGLLWFGQPCFRAFLRAELRLDQVLAISVATNVALFALVGIALVSEGGVVGLLGAISAAHLLGVVLAAVVVRRRVAWRVSFERKAWRTLASEAWPLGANSFVSMVGLRIGPVLLLTFAGPVAVGYFSTSMRLAEALNLVADGLMLAAFPVLARLAVAKGSGFQVLAQGIAKSLGVTMIAVALFLGEGSTTVLEVLFGSQFRPAAPALAWLAWSAVLFALGTLYTNMLVAHGLQRILLGLHVVSSVFQVGLQFFLVPRFGVVGAAAGVVLVSAANHLALAFLPETRRHVMPCLLAVGPLLLGAGFLLGIGWVSPGAGPAKGLALAGAFVSLALVAGWVGRKDVDALRESLSLP